MDIHSLLTVLFIHAAALISPGPDFAVVTKLSTIYGRKTGMMAALGVASAIGCYVLVCAFGLSVVLTALPSLSLFLTCAGALYLGWLGIKSLLSKGEFPAQAVVANKGKAWLTGFFTNILNPKALLYFSSILPQVLKSHTAPLDGVTIAFLLSLESCLWFGFVAFIFSSSSFLFWLKGRLIWFERVIGVILIALAVKLLLSVIC